MRPSEALKELERKVWGLSEGGLRPGHNAQDTMAAAHAYAQDEKRKGQLAVLKELRVPQNTAMHIRRVQLIRERIEGAE